MAKWLLVLEQWLTEDEEDVIQEIIGWYQGWKAFFKQIADRDEIQEVFKLAMLMIYDKVLLASE